MYANQTEISRKGNSRYTEELRRHTTSRIPKEEIPALIEAAQKGDLNARDRVFYQAAAFVVSSAKKYVKPGIEFNDLVQVGNLALIGAIDKFRLDKGVSLLGGVTYAIQEAMGTYARRNARLVDTGRQTIERKKVEDAIKYVSSRDGKTEEQTIQTISAALLREGEFVYTRPKKEWSGIKRSGTTTVRITRNMLRDFVTNRELPDVSLHETKSELGLPLEMILRDTKAAEEGEGDASPKAHICERIRTIINQRMKSNDANVVRMAWGLGEDEIMYTTQEISEQTGLKKDTVSAIVGRARKLVAIELTTPLN